MKEWDNEEQHFKLMQKLQTKHDNLFEKLVFAKRKDKDDIAKSHACEIIAVREMMDMQKHAYLKLKWKMYR